MTFTVASSCVSASLQQTRIHPLRSLSRQTRFKVYASTGAFAESLHAAICAARILAILLLLLSVVICE